MREAQEAILRSKAMGMIARRDWSSSAWKRVGNRLKECISIKLDEGTNLDLEDDYFMNKEKRRVRDDRSGSI